MFKKLLSNNAQFSQLPQSEHCENLVVSSTPTGNQQSYRLRTVPLRDVLFLFFVTLGASGLLGLYIGSSGFKYYNKLTIEQISKYCEPT